MLAVDEHIQLGKRLIKTIAGDASKTAGIAGLIYVSSNDQGFTRLRTESGFVYYDENRVLRDREHLERIKSLVLPPAWENVWICKLANGHLQATGLDVRGRKQYRYHPRWMEIRNRTKFFRLRQFGEALPSIRTRIEKDLSLPGFPQEKVLAAMISLLERVNIRVGNAFYEKLYGSFGLTTLKDHHVNVEGSRMKIMFKGKKGVLQDISLKSLRLARIIQGCKEIPGKELFQYYDDVGNRRSIDSGMVNDYIKEISGSDFTAKDFRTWAGTIHALLAFRQIGPSASQGDLKRNIPAALDMVAARLGNTRAVCKKYYVHPLIIDMYQEGRLQQYVNELDKIESGMDDDGYSPEESVLLRILRNVNIKY